MTFVLNAVALGTFKDTCSVEGIAEALGTNPTRLNTTARKLQEKGYVTLQGEALPWVYPTPEALQAQDKELSESQTKAILAELSSKRRRKEKA